jgi:hypothetical protein
VNDSRALVLCCIALSGCAGGGSNASAALPAASPPPATSSPAALTQTTGRVVDRDTGAPIPGAVVVIGGTLIAGATPPPSLPAGDVAATTAADGTFVLPAHAQAASYLTVFAANHAALHAQPGATAVLGDLALTAPATDELAELDDPVVGLNAVRTRNGLAPVVFDEYALEAARAWVAWEAQTGITGELDPSQPAGAPNASVFNEYLTRHGLSDASAARPMLANLTGAAPGAPGTVAMQNFLAEGPAGPHYQILLAPSATWIGFAHADCRGPIGSPCSPGEETLLQLFIVAPPGISE